IKRGRNIARPATGGRNFVEMSSNAGESPGSSADFNMGRPRTREGDRAALRYHGNCLIDAMSRLTMMVAYLTEMASAPFSAMEKGAVTRSLTGQPIRLIRTRS